MGAYLRLCFGLKYGLSLPSTDSKTFPTGALMGQAPSKQQPAKAIAPCGQYIIYPTQFWGVKISWLCVRSLTVMGVRTNPTPVSDCGKRSKHISRHSHCLVLSRSIRCMTNRESGLMAGRVKGFLGRRVPITVARALMM